VMNSGFGNDTQFAAKPSVTPRDPLRGLPSEANRARRTMRSDG
jgi:hypothetical protein